jgi:peptide-methionine (R)-S-oxide reductase
MYKIIILSFFFALNVCAQPTQPKKQTMAPKINKSESEWEKELTSQQFYILRKKGTDLPGTGQYTYHFDKGVYKCAACGAPLFKSDNKYESHCGWPSFDDAIPGAIIMQPDYSHNMIRTEILCANCGGHLGHIFDDGPQETTGKRYCVNSTSLNFVKKNEKE